MYRRTARLAADGKNIVVERQWQIREDQVGDHNWKTFDRFNTPTLAVVPASKRWFDPIPPAVGICRDEECAEHNPLAHFMTDPRCINYLFDSQVTETSGCPFCDFHDPLEVRYGKRQHYIIGDDPSWVDCKNQQKLLPSSPFPQLTEIELSLVTKAADQLRHDDFISFLIINLFDTITCECLVCVQARGVVRAVISQSLERLPTFAAIEVKTK